MKSENNLYKLLNETRTDFWEYEEVEVSRLEKQQLLDRVLKREKPVQRGRRMLLLAVATVLFLFAGSQTSWGKSVQAAATSLLKDIQYSLSQVLGSGTEETRNGALAVNQIAHFGEAEVKIEDLLVFDDNLLVNLLVDLEGTSDDLFMMGFSDIAISLNGEPLDVRGSSQQGMVLDSTQNIHQSLVNASLNEKMALPEAVTLAIYLKDIHVHRPGEPGTVPLYIEGEATFSIETTAEALTEHTTTYHVNERVIVEELDYAVRRLTINPVLSYLELHSPDREQDYQVMEFRGVNEKGKQVVFVPRTYETTLEEWIGTMMFSEEDSEITTKELAESEWIQLQLHSAGHPIGEAHYQFYGEPFRIDLKK